MVLGDRFRDQWLVSVLCSCALCGISLGAKAANPPPSALIRVDGEGLPEVVPVHDPLGPEMAGKEGLFVGAEGGVERWQVLTAAGRASHSIDLLAKGSRAGNSNPVDGAPLAPMWTGPLVQLRGLARVRGGVFLTPTADAYLLNPKITIRRRPVPGKSPYPATELLLTKRRDQLLRIPLAKGQAKVAWSAIKEVPPSLRDGLLPGVYTLSTADGTEEVRFEIATPEARQHIMGWIGQLAAILDEGETDQAIRRLVTVEHLLAQADSHGDPQPHLVDALDQIEAVPEARLTAHLKQRRDTILASLRGDAPPEPDHLRDAPTGFVPIDHARRLIALGRWKEAITLVSDLPDATKREQALATLYRAVVASEGGPATQQQAEDLFVEALGLLSGAGPEDQIRAHNNFANYLLGRAQDRLYDRSFQIAAGVDYPLLRAIRDWREAEAHYAAALQLARESVPDEKAHIEVNLARLFALLGDLIRKLEYPASENGTFPAGRAAADRAVRQFARAALSSEDFTTRAIAHEILAQLAFRHKQWKAVREHALAGLNCYLQVGSLAGVESIERMLGLRSMQIASSAQEPEDVARANQEALRHLQISQLLAEILRQQVPADRIGRSRAGFLARRAYVNDRIVELLVKQGSYPEALKYAELAKGRAIQDVLAAAVIKPSAPIDTQPTDLVASLDAWPDDVVAVEYFLGSESAFVFLVDTQGAVSALTLRDSAGKPLASRDVILRVRNFLDEQFPTPPLSRAKRMRQRLQAGQGLDHAWQDEFHQFFQWLFPEPLVEEMRKAKTVVIVPHHILHYLPFVGLVTKPDEKPRGPMEMVEPTFLLDEPFDLCYAPSLTAWQLLRRQPAATITRVNAIALAEFGPLNSLPGVKQDIANLVDVFEDRVGQLVRDDEATESRAMKLFQQPGLLFVGTHGANLADQPLRSHLYLRPDESNDGLLTAGELFGNSSGADLVVLSACYSGLADKSPMPGDDLFGISRALLYSGSRTVVSGQWDVFDGTAPELMMQFFVGLDEGRPVPSALADSQRKLLAKERSLASGKFFLHPYFWAVFKSTGDDRTHLGRQ